MKRPLLLLLTAMLLAALPATSFTEDGATPLFREDFDNLDQWAPYFFPKIKEHSVYSIEADGQGGSSLRAESSASASAMVYGTSFDVRDHPHARWRWKVSSVYRNADPETKAGDDYPIRIYVMFEYDPHKAGVGDRLLFGIAKARFGEYPPHSSLSYVWSSRATKKRIFPSPYTDRAMMVVLRAGDRGVGEWQDEAVNMLEDYRAAFGTDPPVRARIAIMNDSDNTGERSVSWIDRIEVGR